MFTALGMVFTFLGISGLFPGQSVELVDERQTDDRFVVVIEHEADTNREHLVNQAFTDTGAIEQNVKELSLKKL